MFYQKLKPESVEAYAIAAITETLEAFKPGLTDKSRIGADGIPYDTYLKSIEFLKGKLREFYDLGREYSCVEASVGLEALRIKERFIEATMLSDAGASTFKGALFALAQCIFAVGKLDALGHDIIAEYFVTVMADVAKGFAFKQFYYIYDKTGDLTDGEKAYKLTQNTTARGEADKGYAYPVQLGLTDDDATTLFLKLLVSTVDSGIVAKHGKEANENAVGQARKCLDGKITPNELDKYFLDNGIAPKGAMSLLCVALFARKICVK